MKPLPSRPADGGPQMMRRGPYKPCFKCSGIGKTGQTICAYCEGYGSISLKIIQKSLKQTNEGLRVPLPISDRGNDAGSVFEGDLT